MRRKGQGAVCRFPFKRWAVCLGAGVCFGVLGFSRYVNTQIKPTLHELAEYQAACATVGALQQAISTEMAREPALFQDLYTVQNGAVVLDAARAVEAQTTLVQAAEQAMQALPEYTQAIPFGSLTNNSLLSGLGPAWQLSLQPQGYVQSQIRENAQSLAINSVRYSAELELTVTVNMILDGRTSTLTVEREVLLASVIVSGETPNYYAAD